VAKKRIPSSTRFLTTLANRYGQRLLYGPAVSVQPLSQRVLLNTKSFCPVSKAKRLSIKRYLAIAGVIAILRRTIRPAAVAGLVVAVAIYAVDAVVAIGPDAHVCQKVLELVPAVADGNSSTTVIFVPSLLRIVAASQHVLPAAKRPALAHAVRPRLCTTVASATDRHAATHALAWNNCFVPAITDAVPSLSGVFAASKADDRKQAVPVAGKVYELRMGGNRMGFSHDVTLLERVACGQSRTSASTLPGSLHFTLSAGERK
jgi:hypothetical protein